MVSFSPPSTKQMQPNAAEVCRIALIPHLATVGDLPVTVDFNVILLCVLPALHLRLARHKE